MHQWGRETTCHIIFIEQILIEAFQQRVSQIRIKKGSHNLIKKMKEQKKTKNLENHV